MTLTFDARSQRGDKAGDHADVTSDARDGGTTRWLHPRATLKSLAYRLEKRLDLEWLREVADGAAAERRDRRCRSVDRRDFWPGPPPLGFGPSLGCRGAGLYDEVAPVLRVLAAPDELRLEAAVAALAGDAQRLLGLFLHGRLVFGGRDVPALRVLVAVSLDTLAGLGLRLSRHQRLLARGWSTSIA